MESSSDDEFFDCQSEPIKYYAVAFQKDKGKGIVTTDINEARTKLKNCRASRFCIFDDPLEAKKFADKPLSDDSELTKKKSISQKKVSDPFPNASQRDLNVLKGAIETGNFEKVKSLVWNNPRHLVTESDSPTLLQVRFRHNALHVAVNFNQAEILSFVLESISQESFWNSIYPTADERCNKWRMQRVLDMYLNAPELGNLETPCHLAAKLGHKECLRALLGQELTDASLRNKGGMRAEQIICQRSPDVFNDARVAEIRQIFSEKLVVLLLDGRGGQVLQPMSHCELLRLLRRRNEEYQFQSANQCGDASVVDAPGFVRAFAGPLDELKAKQLCYRWSVLNAEDASKFEEIRRTDAEKGMEAHGRFLAEQFGTPWRELWRFLDQQYLDLGSEDGLQQLEQHLAKQQNLLEASGTPLISLSHSHSFSAILDQSSSIRSSPAVSSTSNGLLGSLVRMFSRLTLRSRAEEQISPEVSAPAPNSIVTSTPIRNKRNKLANSSLRLQRMPFNMSLTGEGILTPTDRHVRLAVLSGRCEPQRFPRVSGWLEDLSQIDPNHSLPPASPPRAARDGSQLSHPQCMSTPIRPIRPIATATNQFKKPEIPDFHKCLSPFSQIELPD